MSFASEAKKEITQKKIAKPCCLRAACYGIACFAKYFDARGIVLQTELSFVAQYAQKMFGRCGVAGTVEEIARTGGAVYEFAVKAPEEVEKLHTLFGTTGREPSLQIDPRLLICQGCMAAYIAAAFLCSGTVTDPSKEYNLEILTPRTNLAKDFEALLAEHEFAPHRTRRKGVNLVYVKASGHVEDLLTFMGASSASLRLMDQKVYKSLRNQTNRRTNCDTANLSKTANANAGTLRAIQYLHEENALAALPETLRQAAEKREQYPDLALAELAQQFTPAISKSGLSHRLKKLEAVAEQMKQRKEQAAEHV
ncbi:MAG: DNA-binding protein WhiA [Faecalibacterium sp.]|nr:DNA-binding protein WhiA [Faecalibacterium sp.]